MQIYTTTLCAAFAAIAFAITTATVGIETFVFKWGKLISGVPAALPTSHLSRPSTHSKGNNVFTEIVTTTKLAVATDTVRVQARGMKEFWSSFAKEEADSFEHFGEEIEHTLHRGGHYARDVTEDDEADNDEDPTFGDQTDV